MGESSAGMGDNDPVRPPAGLSVGFVPGVTLSKWRGIWAERFPRTRLVVVGIEQSEQRTALDHGRVDLCFVRLPLDQTRLHVIPLYEEVPVVVAARDHPVAAYDALTLADLADEPVIAVDHPDAWDLVAGGGGVILVPESIARSESRRDLVHRPVADGTPTRVGLAWRTDNDNALIEDFIGVVRGRTVNSSRSRIAERPSRKLR